MVIKRFLKQTAIATTLVSLLLFNCSKKPTEQVSKNDYVIYNEKTVEILEKESSQISDFTEDSVLTFSTPQDFEQDNILRILPNSTFSEGILLKIDSAKNKKEFQTSRATIEDAVQECKYHFSFELQPENAMPSSKNITVKRAAAETGFDFDVGFDSLVIHDFDNDPSTLFDQILADGQLYFNADCEGYLDKGFLKINELFFKINAEEKLDFSIFSRGGRLELSESEDLGTLTFPPLTLGPLVITPSLDFYFVGHGKTNFLDFKTEQSLNITLGVHYKNSSWQSIVEKNTSLDFNLSRLSAKSELEGMLGVDFTTKVYGVAGPFAGIMAGAKAEVDIDSDVLWKINSRLEALVGAKAKIFGITLANYNKEIYNLEKTIAQSNSRGELDSTATFDRRFNGAIVIGGYSPYNSFSENLKFSTSGSLTSIDVPIHGWKPVEFFWNLKDPEQSSKIVLSGNARSATFSDPRSYDSVNYVNLFSNESIPISKNKTLYLEIIESEAPSSENEYIHWFSVSRTHGRRVWVKPE